MQVRQQPPGGAPAPARGRGAAVRRRGRSASAGALSAAVGHGLLRLPAARRRLRRSEKRQKQSATIDRADAEPQQPVPQQHARERHQPRVALGDRPVLGQDADRAAAERVEQRRQRLVVDVAQQLLRDRGSRSAAARCRCRPAASAASARRGRRRAAPITSDVRQQHGGVGRERRRRSASGRGGRRRCPGSRVRERRRRARCWRRSTSSTPSAPRKRPPRYCDLPIGAVKKKRSVRYSKSCCTARPMIAAMTVDADHAEEGDRLRERVRRVDPAPCRCRTRCWRP